MKLAKSMRGLIALDKAQDISASNRQNLPWRK